MVKRMIKQRLIGACSASAPYVMAILIAGWLIAQIMQRADDAAYAYPSAVVSYGLISAKTDDEVLTLVERWKRDEWGAQIGALRVLCAKSIDRVEAIGGPNLATKMCRIVK